MNMNRDPEQLDDPIYWDKEETPCEEYDKEKEEDKRIEKEKLNNNQTNESKTHR